MEKQKLIFEIEVEIPALYNVWDIYDVKEEFQSDEYKLKWKEDFTNNIKKDISKYVKGKFSKDTLEDDFMNCQIISEDNYIEDWDELSDFDITFKVKEIKNEVRDN